MSMPKKVSVREEPEGPVFIYRWQNWGFSIIFLFGLFFGMLPLWVITQNQDIPILALFLLIFVAVGLGLAYWALGMMINRSEIRLQNGMLSVRQKPLPWRYRADVPVGDVLAVSQETYYNRGQSTSSAGGFGISVGTNVRNERLVAFVRDPKGGEKALTLVPMMDFAASQFLEQEIEIRLGLRQALSAVEKEMAVEFAQQEEQRIQTVQGKAFLFFFILMAVGCLVGGIWWLVSLFGDQLEARASLSWPETVGKATAYWVTRHDPDSDDSWQTYYTASIEYTYSVGGESYTIEQDLSEQFETERELDQYVEYYYPEGSLLTVYYNPQKPSRALYDRSGPDSILYILAAVLIVCGLLMTLVVWWMGREISKAEGDPQAWKRWSFWRAQIPFLSMIGKGSKN